MNPLHDVTRSLSFDTTEEKLTDLDATWQGVCLWRQLGERRRGSSQSCLCGSAFLSVESLAGRFIGSQVMRERLRRFVPVGSLV